jgi:hypothetical protein
VSFAEGEGMAASVVSDVELVVAHVDDGGKEGSESAGMCDGRVTWLDLGT